MSDILNLDNIKIGNKAIYRLGLGTNRLRDNLAGHELIKNAISLGINFIDTAHTYADGESEAAIGNVLEAHSNQVLIATKGGAAAGAAPKVLRAELETSLRRLKLGSIELYQLHRVDPSIAIEQTMQLMKQFIEEGLVKGVGLSEVSVDTLERARSIIPITSVQNEYNIYNRKYQDVLDYCSQHSIVFIPWFPLGGLRGDTEKVNMLVNSIAPKYSATPQQMALAWLLKKSPVILPIPGTTSLEHMKSNLKAANIDLSQEDYLVLDKA